MTGYCKQWVVDTPVPVISTWSIESELQFQASSQSTIAQTRLADVSLTSDFIAGFCGESETAHADTVELIATVGYDFCYVFPYSMREVRSRGILHPSAV
jgi:hypothetical protein